MIEENIGPIKAGLKGNRWNFGWNDVLSDHHCSNSHGNSNHADEQNCSDNLGNCVFFHEYSHFLKLC